MIKSSYNLLFPTERSFEPVIDQAEFKMAAIIKDYNTLRNFIRYADQQSVLFAEDAPTSARPSLHLQKG
jgi:hypothetical protein